MYSTRARTCATHTVDLPSSALLPYPFRDENIITSQSMTQLHTFKVQSRRHGTRIFHHVGTRAIPTPRRHHDDPERLALRLRSLRHTISNHDASKRPNLKSIRRCPLPVHRRSVKRLAAVAAPGCAPWALYNLIIITKCATDRIRFDALYQLQSATRESALYGVDIAG